MSPGETNHSLNNTAESGRQASAAEPLALSSLPLPPRVQQRRDYYYDRILVGHAAQVRAMCALPDGRIVTGGEDSRVVVWERDAQPSTLEGHQGGVTCVAATSDGLIVSGSADGSVRVWREQGGRSAWASDALRGHAGAVTCLLVLERGPIVSGGADGTVRLWADQVGGALKCETLLGHTDRVRALDQLPNGDVVSAGDDGTARVWPFAHSMREGSVALSHGSKIHSAKALANGDFVTVGPDLATRWSFSSQAHIWTCARLEGVRDAHVLPDGHVVALAGPNSLAVWGCGAQGAWEKTASWDHEYRTFRAVTPTPCGRIIVRATYMDDGDLRRDLQIMRVSPGGRLAFEARFTQRCADGELGELALADGRFVIVYENGPVALHGATVINSGERAAMAQRYFSQAWSTG